MAAIRKSYLFLDREGFEMSERECHLDRASLSLEMSLE
jgi:hypothetical protein